VNVPDILLLALAGFFAGTLNAVAGGGTFFTFSALLAVGLPPIVANASSSVAVLPGSVASSLAYVRVVKRHARRFLPLGLVSALGGGIGALLLLQLSNATFSRLVPWLLLAATLLFALSPLLQKRRVNAKPSRTRYFLGLGLQFITSVYGGFFGAGMGIVMLASLALTEGNDFHLNNAAKNVFAVLIQSVAIVFFISSGVVSWAHALVVMVFCIGGGYAGVVVARRVPVRVIRGFVVVTGLLLSLYYFLR
jgi:uncharacterized membrane protein YfcA